MSPQKACGTGAVRPGEEGYRAVPIYLPQGVVTRTADKRTLLAVMKDDCHHRRCGELTQRDAYHCPEDPLMNAIAERPRAATILRPQSSRATSTQFANISIEVRDGALRLLGASPKTSCSRSKWPATPTSR